MMATHTHTHTHEWTNVRSYPKWSYPPPSQGWDPERYFNGEQNSNGDWTNSWSWAKYLLEHWHVPSSHGVGTQKVPPVPWQSVAQPMILSTPA